MTQSKSYKFHGSLIEFLTTFVTDSPALSITGITKADPAVVTSTAHGLDDGDVIKITGVAGMTEINGGVYIVNNVTSNTFELADVDSTNYTTYSSGGTIQRGSFSNFCELTGFNRSGGTSPEIQTTSLCSDAQEYELGLPDYGTTQLDYKFAPETGIQTALETFNRSGDITAVRITLPNSGGIRTLLGRVQQTSETASNGTIWTASATIRNTGRPVDVEVA